MGPISQRIVSVGLDGAVTQGPMPKLVSASSTLATEIVKEREVLQKAAQKIDDPSLKITTGKIIKTEETEMGSVSWAACISNQNRIIKSLTHLIRETVPREFEHASNLILELLAWLYTP